MGIPATRFWGAFEPAVAQSLSTDQRAEIERVFALDTDQRPSSIGDLRLSFRWFFIRVLWGQEKRSPDRLNQESEMYPVMTKKNAPAIATISVAYVAFWYMVVAVSVGLIARYFLR